MVGTYKILYRGSDVPTYKISVILAFRWRQIDKEGGRVVQSGLDKPLTLLLAAYMLCS